MKLFKKQPPFKPIKVEKINETEINHYARLLKENKLLWNIFEELEKEAYFLWKDASDTFLREDCWFFIQALQKLRGRIEYYIQSATLYRENKETLEE